MKAALRFFIIISVCAAALGCQRMNPFSEGKVIARVGDKKLYERDVQSLFTPGITPQDSVKLLESYVDVWVRKQLKVREAEAMFGDGQQDIDKLVEEYRNSLLTHKLDQYYIDHRLDTLYDHNAIAEYYRAHRDDFILDRALVKGVIVKLPDNFRQRKELKEMMCGNGERYQDFLDISRKNDFELHEFLTWSDFAEFTAQLPASADRQHAELLATRGVTEFRQDGDIYYACVQESLRAGDPSPVERVSDVIRRTLVNQRKQEIVRSYEDSLYRSASAGSEVEVRIY